MSPRRVLVLGALLVLAACAKNGFARFNALPDPEQTPFDRCADGLHGHAAYLKGARECGKLPVMSDDYQPCWERLRGTYADLPDASARTKWLADEGCPPDVIAGKAP